MLLNRGSTDRRSYGTCKTSRTFWKKWKLDNIFKDDEQTHNSFDAIFFIPENEISNCLKKKKPMIPRVRLIPEVPRFTQTSVIFPTITKLNGSYTKNIVSPCIQSEACRVIVWTHKKLFPFVCLSVFPPNSS